MKVERIVVGTALVLAAPVLLPIARTTLEMAGRLGAKTIETTWSSIRTTACLVKEEVEDIVAEAQFERMKKKIDNEMY
jgi:hypothetical protein